MVTDHNDHVLTTVSRLNELYAKGYRFEAAIAQAALVEGLLLHYLLVAKHIDLVAFDRATETRLAQERITFGQIKDALTAANAFHDTALASDVAAYVLDRNHIAHHLTARLIGLDLEQFYARGTTLAFALWKRILDKTADDRRRNS